MTKPPRKRRTNGFDPRNRPQNKPLRDRVYIRPPRTKNLRVEVAFEKNAQRNPQTLSKYRQGYRIAFDCPAAANRLLKHGFKLPGTYRNNQQGGFMFSMPYDIPKSFTDEEAGWICRECYKCKKPKLTKSQMESVRAMLSYAFQLRTGKMSNCKFKANFESVKDQFGSQNDYAEATKSNRAKHSVEPSGLKTAWTTPFNPKNSMPFPEWCVGGQISWDWGVIGCRGGPKGGLKRIKESRDHLLVPSQGVMTTKFRGGRPKVPGFNKNRDWYAIRICLCENGKHVPPPRDWMNHLDAKCNPCYEEDEEKNDGSSIPWCTFCPLNMFQCIQDLLPEGEKNRIYPTWVAAQHRYGKLDLGKKKIIPLARAWYRLQGGNPDNVELCSNSGRKSLGKWCSELAIPYRESFPIHGDLWSTWSRYYQATLVTEPEYQEREQPRDLDECSKALWKLARWFGRGRTTREDPIDFSQSQIGQLLAATLRSLGQSDLVANILRK